MRMRRSFLLALPAALLLPGCAAVGTAAIAADTAIGVTGAAVGTAGNVAEGAVRLAIPGDGKDTDEDEDDDRAD